MLEFIRAIEAAGIPPPETITIDGALKRFSGNGDRGDLSAYYCLHDHGGFSAGFFGDWRSGYYETWTSRNESELTPDQRREYREKIEKAKADADRIRKAEAEQAAIKAKKLWDQAKQALPNHTYLTNKQVKPHGIRQDGNVLLIPVMDIAGNIKSIQRIFPDGGKFFLKGGATRGGFYRIPGDDTTIYICEGYATGATIREATGNAVIVAFNAGNLKPVAEVIAKHYPDKQIVICADNDRKTAGNPGLTIGKEAAAAIGAGIVWPEFGEHETGSDFNDLAAIHGPEAVKVRLSRIEQAGDNSSSTEQSKAISEISTADITAAAFDRQKGAAGLFARIYKDRFAYDHAAAIWYVYQGHYWQVEPYGEPLAGCDVVMKLFRQARNQHAGERELLAGKLIKTGGDDIDINKIKADIAEADRKYKACSDQANALTALHNRKSVVEFAAQGPGSLGISGDEWDLKPWFLPGKNGVIDLKTGLLHPGRQSDYLKTFCSTAYDQAAICPTWENALLDIFNNDLDLVLFIQRLFGYSLIGEVIEHILPIFYGIGRNGKDTILSAVHHVLGDLAGPVQAEMLLDHGRGGRSSAGPSPDIMALRGRRLAWAAETNEGRKMDTARVKYLTGGTWLTGRPPFGKRDVSFPPSHTLILMTNHKPRINADDYAAWKRVLLIPFQMSFVDDPKETHERPKDPDLVNKLKSEATGILAWLVQGCLDWQKHGLAPPDIVKNATMEYQAAEDIINLFIADCCKMGADFSTSASELYQAYRQWADDNGLRPMSGTAFGTRMKKRFEGDVVKHQNKTIRIYNGIGIEGLQV